MTVLRYPPGRHHSQAQVAYALRKSHHARARGARRAPKMPILKSWAVGWAIHGHSQLALVIGQHDGWILGKCSIIIIAPFSVWSFPRWSPQKVTEIYWKSGPIPFAVGYAKNATRNKKTNAVVAALRHVWMNACDKWGLFSIRHVCLKILLPWIHRFAVNFSLSTRSAVEHVPFSISHAHQENAVLL